MTRSRKSEKALEEATEYNYLPNFFICGAARAGTTALWRYLQQHPEIFMPQEEEAKEPGYFSQLRPMNNLHQYLSLFQGASENQVIGEASTAYLTSPDSASRIANAIPDAKIIIILRNPADRAYSLYQWMVKEGYEHACSFRKALRLEKQKRYGNRDFRFDNREYYYNYLYFYSGLYSDQLERYLAVFPRSQIFVIVFEEFVGHECVYTNKLFKFLGVNTDFVPEIEVHNESRGVRCPPIQFTLRNYVLPAFRKFFGKRSSDWIEALMKMNTSSKKPYPDRSLYRYLLRRYREDIRRTSYLVNKDLETIWLDDVL